MNLPHKYNVGETVYSVEGYKIGRGIVLNRLYIEGKDIQIRYEVLGADHKRRITSEAYLVSTLEEAKESARINSKTDHELHLQSIDELTDEIFDYIEKKTQPTEQ